MTDIEAAIAALRGHTLALCKNGELLTSDKRGVSPMADYLTEGRDLSGFSAADVIVGKAAAMLFIKAGIKEIYAEVISTSAEKLLKKHAIPFSFGSETEKILNRDKTGICPMENAVSDTDDTEEGFKRISEKLMLLRNKSITR